MKKIDEQIKHAARSSINFKLGKNNKQQQKRKKKKQKKRMKKKKKIAHDLFNNFFINPDIYFNGMRLDDPERPENERV